MKALSASRSRTGVALWWLENRRRGCTNVEVVPQPKGAISELLMLLARGPRKQVYVEGRLSSRTYQTQSGETLHSLDINVTDVQFLGQRDSSGGEAVGAAEAAGHHVPGDDQDLPL